MKLTKEALLPYTEKFFKKVRKEIFASVLKSPCWTWEGPLRGNNRYGSFIAGDYIISAAAHRASWVIHFGEIPEKMEVCHRCDNSRCVNPDHLFLGTHRENMRDMVKKGRQGPRFPKCGEKSNWNRFSREDVLKIRELYSEGWYQKDIAKIFKTHQTTISGIIRCANWKHLGLPSLSRFPKPKRKNYS